MNGGSPVESKYVAPAAIAASTAGSPQRTNGPTVEWLSDLARSDRLQTTDKLGVAVKRTLAATLGALIATTMVGCGSGPAPGGSADGKITMGFSQVGAESGALDADSC